MEKTKVWLENSNPMMSQKFTTAEGYFFTPQELEDKLREAYSQGWNDYTRMDSFGANDYIESQNIER